VVTGCKVVCRHSGLVGYSWSFLKGFELPGSCGVLNLCGDEAQVHFGLFCRQQLD
jgi:hypothetical protein